MKHLKKLTLTLVALFTMTAGAQAMMALVGVHDDIEDKDLTAQHRLHHRHLRRE